MSLTTVTLSKDMRPWRKGDHIHIASKLAELLVRNGEAIDPRPFRPPNAPPASNGPIAPARLQKAPERPILHLGRKARR